MVDRIGTSSLTPPDPRPVATATPAAAAASAKATEARDTESGQNASGQTSEAVSLRKLARELATKPPVDMARIAEIKRAIANGTYPIEPETIADRLVAISLDWK